MLAPESRLGFAQGARQVLGQESRLGFAQGARQVLAQQSRLGFAQGAQWYKPLLAHTQQCALASGR